MKSKITYFMEKDTRIILDNLTKVIVSENVLLISYTILRRTFENGEIVVVKYIKNKNRMIIYDGLKKYNSKVYKRFIEWANEKGIEIFKQNFREEMKV